MVQPRTPKVEVDTSAVASNQRFEQYLDLLTSAVGLAKRQACMRAYCIGLLLQSDRKSIEPIAARLAPSVERVSATHQALQHFIGNSNWSDEAVLQVVREYTLPVIEKHAPIDAWIADDTGIPKQGKHSVGVAHQYCGQLGKQARCQVAVMLSIANEHASLPVAYRLYLPDEWANDAERRTYAKIPEKIAFSTKPQIALQQVRAALDAGIPRATFIADAAYGNDTKLRDCLTEWQVPYAVAVQGTTMVWPPGVTPLPPKPWNGKGRKPTHLQRDETHRPISVKQLAMELPSDAYQNIEWRPGTGGPLVSRFAAIRVRAAHGETTTQRDEEWLLIEWAEGEKEPRKYWLSTLPETTTLLALVQTVQKRWRIEHDFLELKDELGLNQFEGRSWQGFHHHGTMCIAAYGFLLAERGLFSPSGSFSVPVPALSHERRPRGSPEHFPTS